MKYLKKGFFLFVLSVFSNGTFLSNGIVLCSYCAQAVSSSLDHALVPVALFCASLYSPVPCLVQYVFVY